MKTNAMRIVRNLFMAAMVMMVAVVVMPKNVWAARGDISVTNTPASGYFTVEKDGTVDILIEYECADSDSTFKTESFTVSDSTISVVSTTKGARDGSNKVIFTVKVKGEALSGTPNGKLNFSIADECSTHSGTTASGSGYVDVRVISSATKSLTLDNTSLDITSTGTLTATSHNFTPSGSISWSSSNTSVATVDATGTTVTITAVGHGTTTITATADDGTGPYTASCTVNVTIPATGISVEDTSHNTSGSIDISSATKTISLKATLTPAGSDSTITWTSSAPTVASVSGTGDTATVTGLAGGTATITATANGHSDTYSVTVNNPLQSLVIDKPTVSIGINESVTVNATPTPNSPYPTPTYVWTSSAPGVATVTGSGATAVIKGVTAGTATITITPNGDATKAKTVSVTVKPGIVSASLADVNVTKDFTKKMTDVLTVSPSDAVYKKIEWSSSDESKVSIDDSGKVTGKDGNATITGKIYDFSDALVATVTAKVTVYSKPSISYSDNKLKISLPDKIYTGNKDVSSVSKGVLKVYYDGECLYTSGASSDYANDKTISADSIQTIIKKSDIYNKLTSLDKDTTELKFRILGSDGSTTNEDAYGEVSVNVYKQVVSGTGIKTAKEFAVNGVSVKLTATPESGYTFSKWEDGTTTNPRTITVSGAANYKATGVLGAQNPNAAGGAGSAGGANGAGGSNSKYDKVPKTGEGASVMIMWFILVVSILVAGGAVVIGLNPDVLAKFSSKKNKEIK